MRWWMVMLLVLLVPAEVHAFCGFYVAGADRKMFNDATMVVLMREGKRTVLSMRNDYRGPPEKFALVVPVPQVLQKENVKVLPDEVFERVDGLSAPRLVEYWEQDPCDQDEGAIGLGSLGTMGFGAGAGTGRGFGSGRGRVKVEAEFAVGEYDIVVLSADDSGALDRWLKTNGYSIPDGAEPYLRPYVASGSKFFVAKVDPARVTFEDGQARLSPLRFHYDSDELALPIRLGLINADESQDLIIHILAQDRYDVANYPTATIPTNLDVKAGTKEEFSTFYGALFEEALGPKQDAVVTEYAWSAGACDPCPTPPLKRSELLTLGADVLAGEGEQLRGPARLQMGRPRVTGDGTLAPEVAQRVMRRAYGPVRSCHHEHAADVELTGALEIVVGDDGKVREAKTMRFPGATRGAFTTCLVEAVKQLTYPAPEGGTAKVLQPLSIRRMPVPAGTFARTMVLTRLHARYRKDTLGADLVFKRAEPIVGGREVRLGGELEQGSKPASVNNFQARYAIRHRWEGPLECDKPIRGVWGPPPRGEGGGAAAPRPKPMAARDLGRAAKRGVGVTAASFLTDGKVPPIARGGAAAPEAAPVLPPPAPPSPGADTSKSPAGCRCELGRTRSPDAWWSLGLLALALATRRRRTA